MKPRDNTEAELAAYDEACSRLAGFDERLSEEWIEGYLTALAAGPRRIATDEWLPRLCGDAFERCFADPADAAQARAALAGRAEVLAQQLDPEALLDDPDSPRLLPLIYPWDDEARRKAVEAGAVSEEDAQLLATGQEWVAGFLGCVEDFAGDWHFGEDIDDIASEQLRELLDHIGALALTDGSEELVAHVQRYYKQQAPTREELVDEAIFAIQDLRLWWLDHAPKPATRHVGPTPGRNDPCPCGSGKKFKKCHGASA